MAGGAAGFGVDRREQVLEHLAQEFGIQGHFPLGGGVFLDGEFVAVEQVDQAGLAGAAKE